MMIGSACIPSSCGGRCSSYHPRGGVFEWPRRRTTEQRYELAASNCPMPPVLPTERIAHLGTADCCIHPPGRNEMIARSRRRKFFSNKEVAQNRPPHLPCQQPPSPPKIVYAKFPGMGPG